MCRVSEQRDRQAVLDEAEDFDTVPWNYLAIGRSFKGVPWWAAILCAWVPAAISAFIDINATKTIGWTFNVAFFVGALAAILLVQRRSLFAPMVQPPLILAATVPILVLLTGGVQKPGLGNIALGLGRPLIESFPVMAITTAVTVALGILRIFIEKDPNRPTKDEVREAKAELKARSKPARKESARKEPAERRDADAEDRPRRPRPEGAPARRPRPEGAPARRPRPEGAARGERPAGQRRPRPPREDR